MGWNKVGGNRLWLRDGQGNLFYFAHLSAFTPLAVNGNKVTTESLTKWIETGDSQMPGMKDLLDAAQIRDVVAYVKTL